MGLDSKRIDRLLILAAVVTVGVLVTYAVGNKDIFWHMANGRAMLEEGRIINEEIFSYTAAGAEFVNRAWLTQIVFYLFYTLAGVEGLAVLKILLTTGTVWFLYKTARVCGASPGLSFLLVTTSVYMGVERYMVRPNLLSFLFMSVLAYLLFGFRAGRLRWQYILFVPALIFIWHFFHVAFFGMIFLVSFVTGETVKALLPGGRLKNTAALPLDKPGLRRLWLALGLSVVAIIVNPYGLPHYAVMLEYYSRQGSPLFSLVAEYMPTPLEFFHLFWAILALLGVLFVVFIRRADITLLLISIPFSVLAVQHVRSIALFGIVVVPVFAHFGGVVEALVLGHRRGKLVWRAGLVGLAVALLVSTATFKFGASHPWHFGVGLRSSSYPEGATRVIQETGLQGRMFNMGDMGGYLAFMLHPERKIMLYNMPEVFSDVAKRAFNREFLDAETVTYGVVWNTYYRNLIFGREDWALLYWDEGGHLVARDIPENRRIIARYGLTYYTPENGDRLEEFETSPAILPELTREVARCLSFGTSQARAAYLARLLSLKKNSIGSEEALALLEGALGHNSGSPHLWFSLGKLHYENRRLAQAEEALRKALSSEAAMSEARVLLAYVEYDTGRYPLAEEDFLRAVRAEGVMPEAHFGLGLTRKKLGKYELAVEDFERFLGLSPKGQWAEKARLHIEELEKKSENR
jgi:tetratricopeptide (TPR) repeat protein